MIAGIGLLTISGVILGLHHRAASPTQAFPWMGSPRAVGHLAPEGTFTTTTGRQVSVGSLRGHPTLLWFVSTWCSSCQAGTQVVAQNLDRLRAEGVRVVEVELYRDLGQPGPGIAQFGRQLAGSAYGDPDWIFATSTQALTRTYDPGSYLDIYYLIDARGHIAAINGSPAATMSTILTAAAHLKASPPA